MCEPADPRLILRGIPSKLWALQHLLPVGSAERKMLECVYDSVRNDVEYVQRAGITPDKDNRDQVEGDR